MRKFLLQGLFAVAFVGLASPVFAEPSTPGGVSTALCKKHKKKHHSKKKTPHAKQPSSNI